MEAMSSSGSKIEVYRHRAGDTADIQVALNAAVVYAGERFALSACGIVLGNVGGQTAVVVLAEHLILQFLKDIGDVAHLIAYLLKVVEQDITLRLGGAAYRRKSACNTCKVA